MKTHGLAFDKASVRSKDKDGRLHVAMSNISKATVNPYYGAEIPGYEELGLDPESVYQMLRDPEELAKAVSTFNNMPVLSEHIRVTPEAPEHSMVIGSTGTDAVFNDPYLQNSTVFWDGDAIGDIEAERKREFSSAYYYRADMTSGTFRGLRYDGVMRDIVANHVALVDEGRAGSDVMVGDSIAGTHTMLKSRRAIMLSGALSAFVAPKLAKDAKVDFSGLLDGVTAVTLAKDNNSLAKKIVALVKPQLAKDGDMDVSDVIEVIQAVQGSASAEPVEDDELNDEAPAAEDEADVCPTCGQKKVASDEEPDDAPKGAEDENDDDDDKEKYKAAMDKRIKAVETSTIARMNAIRAAEKAVFPIVGEITTAMDSAADVYKLALDARKVSTKGVHPSAFGAMVAMLKGAPVKIAEDKAPAGTSFAERFPNATKLKAS